MSTILFLDDGQEPSTPFIADLPDELWRLVAEYVVVNVDFRRPERWMSVNRSFFNFFLDRKYGEVKWTKIDKEMLATLERLQSPLIASHVRRIHIFVWFINSIVQGDAARDMEDAVGAHSPLQRSLASFFGTLTQTFTGPVTDKQSKSRLTAKGVASRTISSRSLLNSMVKAVQFMKNVVVFYFEWRDLPLTSQSRLFLQIISANFSTSLRKLALRARIGNFAEFLAISDFPNVDEVDFHFDYEPLGSTVDQEGKTLLDVVAPFVNRHARQLRTIVISSSSHADLSRFFQQLDPLPKLNRLGLRISFNIAHLSDPSILPSLLGGWRASLRHVEIVPNHLDVEGEQRRANQHHTDWANASTLLIARTDCLHNLVSGELPYTTPEHTFPILARSVPTLQRLKLTGHFLDRSAVEALLHLFAEHPFQLQSLWIGVKILDLYLLALLARRLPALLSLVLIYQQALPLPSYSPDVATERIPCPYKGYDHFTLKDRGYSFADWPLEELSFYCNRYSPPLPISGPYRKVHHFGIASDVRTTFDLQFGLAFFDEIPTLSVVGGYPVHTLLNPPTCFCIRKRGRKIRELPYPIASP